METTYVYKILSLASTKNQYGAAEWMSEIGLLQMKCAFCKLRMKLRKCTGLGSKFACMWICEDNKKCFTSIEVNVRKGTVFELYTLEFYQHLHLIYFWNTTATEKGVSVTVGVTERDVEIIYSIFRHICVNYFVRNPVKLGGGGGGKTVLVRMKRIRKFSILELIDIGASPVVGYLTIVDSFEKSKVEDKIKKVVNSEHLIPESDQKEYTDAIFSYELKHHDLLNKPTTDDEFRFNSYLNQAMWLDRFGDEPCYNLCEHIKRYYLI